jgi:A nuclease of the HNH/ENDO VII superfamily with conserved WHH
MRSWGKAGSYIIPRLGIDFSYLEYLLYQADEDQSSIVKLKYTGSREGDFAEANLQGNIHNWKDIKDDYVWHHLDDYDHLTNEGTMQLVSKFGHRTTHFGCASQWRQAWGRPYSFR